MDAKKNKTLDKKNILKRKRTLSRLIAAQTYYQYEFYNEKEDIVKIFNDLVDNYVMIENEEIQSLRKIIDIDFINNLLEALRIDIQYIDEEIKKMQKHDLDNFMIQLVRLGCLELRHNKNIDSKIILDEYVFIGSLFFDKSRLGFLNSIIDNYNKKIRTN